MKKLWQGLTIVNIFFFAFGVLYIYLFVKSINHWWFNPMWATDDSLQQSFIYHNVLHPGLFAGDIITEMMTSYVSPLHRWLCYGLTWILKDGSAPVVMMGHWMMLIQVMVTAVFVFLTARALSCSAAGFFSVAWLFHTRHLMQRLTAGLQRGWAPAMMAAYLYFLASGRHKCVWVLLFIGCLLHPPSTVIIAISYWLFLAWKLLRREERPRYLRLAIAFAILNPFIAITAEIANRKPSELGKMVSYSEAKNMPEFFIDGGRFKMVPLLGRWDEIAENGFQTFVTKFYDPGDFLRENIPLIVVAVFILLLAAAALKKRRAFGPEVLTFLLGLLISYELARVFAFKLFVPQRYIQLPLATFFIVAFPAAFWILFHRKESETKVSVYSSSRLIHAWGSALALACLAVCVWIGAGSGLQGNANFNMPIDRRGDIWPWIAANTPVHALFAGHPTHVDPLPFFAARNAFATTETAHPFYDRYYAEIKRRLIISLRAQYARDFPEVLSLLEPEGIDYFIFRRADFLPGKRKKLGYFRPIGDLVKKLRSRDLTDYAAAQLPSTLDPVNFPFLVFIDDQSAVIDLHELKDFLLGLPLNLDAGANNADQGK